MCEALKSFSIADEGYTDIAPNRIVRDAAKCGERKDGWFIYSEGIEGVDPTQSRLQYMRKVKGIASNGKNLLFVYEEKDEEWDGCLICGMGGFVYDWKVKNGKIVSSLVGNAHLWVTKDYKYVGQAPDRY
jgi:hypothetical protein